MRHATTTTLFSLITLSVMANAFAAESAVDPIQEGQWEFNNVMKMAGLPVIPELPANIQLPNGVSLGSAQGGGMSMTIKQCITNADLTPPTRREGDMECRMTQQDRKGGTYRWAVHCTGPNTDVTSKGVAQYTATTMTGDATSRGKVQGYPADMTMHTTGKYLGPCPTKARQ